MQPSATSQLSGSIKNDNSIEMIVSSLPVSADDCWNLIATDAGTSEWFGRLPEGLIDAAQPRLDFEDGDFFTISDVKALALHSLEYSWRFLGLGAPSRIAWRIETSRHGSSLVLADTSPRRASSQAQELLEGWTDFLERLQRHIDTREITRYPFRSEFDACIEVPLHPKETLSCIGDQGLQDLMKRVVAATDPGQTIISYTDETRNTLAFEVRREHWDSETECNVSVSSTGKGSKVHVQQGRWNLISRDEEVCRRERSLYSAAWIMELSRLEEYASLC